MLFKLKQKFRRNEFLRRNPLLWQSLRRVYRFAVYYLKIIVNKIRKPEQSLLYVKPSDIILPNQGAGSSDEREMDLYQEIERNDYKTQKELKTDNILDEVKIQIGATGELILVEGKHRVTVAQRLRMDQIPVIVTQRHSEWDSLRQAVIDIVIQRGFFHQPFNHPDLDIIPQIYGNERKDKAMYGNERWHYIMNSLPIDNGTVLDIGSYFGYFAHRFEELGFMCYALEPDKENLTVLKQYRQMKEKKFIVWERYLCDIENYDFDIVLALNIFHHLVKTKHDYDQLVQFLSALRCQAMYFEPHKNAPSAYGSFSDDEFTQFVIDHSILKHSRWLGATKERRNVYLLTV